MSISLTTNQRLAIETNDENVIVLAGAGSGKTRVLTDRIKRLLNAGVDPEAMLILTFTRRAAQEMRGRVGRNMPMLGTFHAVSLHILRENAELLGYDPAKLKVVDEEESDILLTLAKTDVTTKKMSIGKLRAQLEAYYSGRIDKFNDDDYLIIGRYHQILRSAHALDYGLILRELQRLFKENPSILEGYQAMIQHVMVDEYQDTDRLQYSLHRLFWEQCRFFAVGDLRQSIYNFRGAEPDLLHEYHRESTRIELNDNFRSGSDIVKFANNVIGGDYSPMKGKLGVEGRVRLVVGDLQFLADDIRRIVERDAYSWGEIAVLARKHSLLTEFQSACDFPVSLAARTATLPFRLFRYYCRLAIDQHDGIARIMIEHGTPEFSKKRAEWQEGGFDGIVKGTMTGDARVSELLERMAQFGVPDSETARLERIFGQFTIEGALRRMEDHRPDRGDLEIEPNSVTLVTIHAAKGLEWPVVVLLDASDGNLPLTRTGIDLAEEKRLAYVGVTRAGECLTVHHRPEKEISRFFCDLTSSFSQVERQPDEGCDKECPF